MRKVRLGFLGVGWIGRNRMEAILATDAAEAVAICEPDDDMAAAAQALAPKARRVGSLEELLGQAPDGVVIATPSAHHAAQSIQALEAGAAVFCQKPLGRTADEVERVLGAASRANRPLGVDLSYRHTRAALALRDQVRSGALGKIFAIDLVFHNAYGPDKAWFYDPARSGGGCVIDLGVHLVDLALWLLDFPGVARVSSRLFSKGGQVPAGGVEDFAVATIDLAGGTVVRIACSWRLPAGTDAAISAEVYGTDGGAALRNVDGSFYDFVAERFSGTSRETIAGPPDDWGGRAAAQWARSLQQGARFDASTQGLIETARVLDMIYRADEARGGVQPAGTLVGLS